MAGESSAEARPYESKEELKIAWRYENLSVDSNLQRSAGTSYDLSAPFQLTEEQKSKAFIWDGSDAAKYDEPTGKINRPPHPYFLIWQLTIFHIRYDTKRLLRQFDRCRRRPFEAGLEFTTGGQ